MDLLTELVVAKNERHGENTWTLSLQKERGRLDSQPRITDLLLLSPGVIQGADVLVDGRYGVSIQAVVRRQEVKQRVLLPHLLALILEKRLLRLDLYVQGVSQVCVGGDLRVFVGLTGPADKVGERPECRGGVLRLSRPQLHLVPVGQLEVHRDKLGAG